MLRPEVGGACLGVAVSANCVGREAVEAAVLTQHFYDYKRRGIRRERKEVLVHYDLTTGETRRVRLSNIERALKLSVRPETFARAL